MRRLQRPLDPKAVQAANAALAPETGGRQLTMEPEDAALREKWIDAYLAAGGKEAKNLNSRPVRRSVQPCPATKWIELRYLHCDDSPVKEARYNIESPEFSQSGTLDANGFIHIDGVPDNVYGFKYWFEKDPEKYEPKPPEVSTSTAAVKAPAASTLDEIGNWLWGTVQGDFNKDQSVSQIAVNMVLGFIPLVDQALDIRDIIAGLKDIIEFYMEDESKQQAHEDVLGVSYELWMWINVFIIALGAIPIVGSAVKGVLKVILKFLKDTMKKAGNLSPSQLRHIWEEILKVLNHLAIKQGNAHQWLKEFPGKLSGWMDEAAQKITKALDSIKMMIDQAEKYAKRLSGNIISPEQAQKIIDRVTRYRGAITKAYNRLDEMKRKVNEWIADKITEILGGKHKVETNGDTLTKAEKTGPNVHKQEEAPVPEMPKKAKYTTPTGNKGDKPTGKKTEIGKKDDADTKRSLERENDAADKLANEGYKVEQNPKGQSKKNPDYKIEGEYWDCYAPKTKDPRNIIDNVAKKVNEGQAKKIVLNLADSDASLDELRVALANKVPPPEGLEEILVLTKDGNMVHLYP